MAKKVAGKNRKKKKQRLGELWIQLIYFNVANKIKNCQKTAFSVVFENLTASPAL